MAFRFAPGACLGLVMTACAPTAFEGTIDDPATGPRLAALARIEQSEDRAAIPKAVECLVSNDPLVRHAAIRTLQSLTGQTLDYRPDDPPLTRRKAVDRWVEWCRQEELVPSAMPSA